MDWILYIIAVIWVALGSLVVIYTTGTRKAFKDAFIKMNPRLIALLPLLVGFLLIAGAKASSHFWPVLILGILGLAKGAVFLMSPPERLDVWMKWWFLDMSEAAFRLWGLIAVIFGVTLIYWI
jgi:hypothetical protein